MVMFKFMMKNMIIYQKSLNLKPNMDHAHLLIKKIGLFRRLMILNYKIINKF